MCKREVAFCHQVFFATNCTNEHEWIIGGYLIWCVGGKRSDCWGFEFLSRIECIKATNARIMTNRNCYSCQFVAFVAKLFCIQQPGPITSVFRRSSADGGTAFCPQVFYATNCTNEHEWIIGGYLIWCVGGKRSDCWGFEFLSRIECIKATNARIMTNRNCYSCQFVAFVAKLPAFQVVE